MFYKSINQQTILINYRWYLANLLLIMFLVLTTTFCIYQFTAGKGLSDNSWINLGGYLIILSLLFVILFKHIFINVPHRIFIKKSRLEINDKDLFELDSDSLNFVFQNLSGKYGDWKYCICFFEQGYGIKNVRYNIAGFIHEKECIKLARFIKSTIPEVNIIQKQSEKLFEQ